MAEEESEKEVGRPLDLMTDDLRKRLKLAFETADRTLATVDGLDLPDEVGDAVADAIGAASAMGRELANSTWAEALQSGVQKGRITPDQALRIWEERDEISRKNSDELAETPEEKPPTD